MLKLKCRRCWQKRFWRVRRGKLRCRNCLYEFKPRVVKGLNLKIDQWRKLLKWFLRSQSSNTVREETGLSKYRVLKALTLVRQVMVNDVPSIFRGTVKVDETYLGGQKKNKTKKQLFKEKEAGREYRKGLGTTKQPVFGILARSGYVWAALVNKTEARNLILIIEKRVRRGTKICFDTWRAYTGLATRGYVHRTVEHGKKKYVRGRNHINGLEGLFGYLKRQLASRGGIRRERLPL